MNGPRDIVRLAKAADAAPLPDIERSSGQLFRGIPELAWIADDDVMTEAALLSLIELGCVWVAELDGAVVGFVVIRKEPGLVHVQQLSVTPSAQGRGFGKRLMATVHGTARDEGRQWATLTTFRDVPWNDAFYARLGYRVVAESGLDERLSAILAAEKANGLPIERRCAMRLALN